MLNRSLVVHAALGLVLVVTSGAATAGPVTGITQTRTVHVAIPSIEEGVPAVDETTTAPDNNPFTATLDRTLSQLEQTNHALASQDSSFGEVSNVFSVSAAGQTRYSATGLSGIVFADSNLQLNFTLDDTRSYNISGNGSFVDTSGGASNFSVTLTNSGGTVFSFTKADFNPNNNDGAVVTPNFSTSGALAPGAYTMNAVSGVSGGTNINEVQASFAFDFSATGESDGGGGTPIPLPAGVWPGSLMLLGLAGLAARRRFSLAA